MQTLRGTGEIVFVSQGNFQQSSSVYAGNGVTLTIESCVTIRGGKGRVYAGGNSSIVNEGTISANSPNDIIRVESGHGVGGSFVNRGVLESPGGILEMGGSGMWIFDEGSLLRSHGGRIQLATTIDLDGGEFALSAATGDIHLYYGGFANGLIRSTDGAGIRVDGLIGSSFAAGLHAVTLEAPVWVYNRGELRITGGLTLNSTITLGFGWGSSQASGSVVFWAVPGVSEQTLRGSGEVRFNQFLRKIPGFIENKLAAGPGVQLTIESGVTIRGGGGMVRAEQNATITNYARITADVAGFLYLGAGHPLGMIHNRAPLHASNGGTLNISPIIANRVLIEAGSSLSADAGTIVLSATIDNTGRTLHFDSIDGVLELRNGTITGGSIDTAGGAVVLGHLATLVGVTLNAATFVRGEVKIREGLTMNGSLTFEYVNGYSSMLVFETTSFQALFGNADLIMDMGQWQGGIRAAVGVSLDVGSGISIRGAGMLRADSGSASVTVRGQVSADVPGRTLGVSAAPGSTVALLGGVRVEPGSTLSFAGGGLFVLASDSGAKFVGGQLRVSNNSVVELAEQTLTVSGPDGSIYLDRGEIRGGVLRSLSGATIQGTSAGGAANILRDVRVLGALSLTGPQSSLLVAGSTRLGHLTIAAPGSILYFEPEAEIHGDIHIRITQSTAQSTIRSTVSNARLTLATGSSIRLAPDSVAGIGIGSGSLSRFIIRGALVASGPQSGTNARTITIAGRTVNEGMIEVDSSVVVSLGSYEQASGGRIVLWGSGPDTLHFGRIQATGVALLDGSLEVRIVSGFELPRGSSFRFVTSAGASGEFSSIITPPLSDPDLKSPVLIDSQGVRLIVTHIADFNNRLSVNEADIFAFLIDWFAGGGDFDGDDERTVTDIYVFLAAWYAA